jgi:outer membrane protein assembly factor BamE
MLKRLSLIFILLFPVAGCTVFRLPTVQGNVIEQKDVDKLEMGMTEDQVRAVLGGPLLQDSFNPSQWDYVYYYRDPKRRTYKRNLSLYFETGKLARIVGREEPKGADNPLASPEALGKVQEGPEGKVDSGAKKKR